MGWSMNKMALVVTTLIMSLMVKLSSGISCYECDSSNNFSCTEFWDPSLPVTSQYYSNCSHVFEARYCVKMTGVYDGKLGTKRFCSSKDWGNYCEYIERPGDIQEYRSCVFSCSLSGCNGATGSAQLTFWTKLLIGSMSVIIPSYKHSITYTSAHTQAHARNRTHAQPHKHKHTHN